MSDMALKISSDDDAYAIMARKRVRAIAGADAPTIDHYHQALMQCIADKAGDWRAACESAAEASKEIGRLKGEIARLRLTDAERESLRIVSSVFPSEKHAATLRGLLERMK